MNHYTNSTNNIRIENNKKGITSGNRVSVLSTFGSNSGHAGANTTCKITQSTTSAFAFGKIPIFIHQHTKQKFIYYLRAFIDGSNNCKNYPRCSSLFAFNGATCLAELENNRLLRTSLLE